MDEYEQAFLKVEQKWSGKKVTYRGEVLTVSQADVKESDAEYGEPSLSDFVASIYLILDNGECVDANSSYLQIIK